jgi:hypothetical protein
MGEYADVKRKKILSLLRWLATQDGFSIDNGGRHQWVVKHESWSRSFPVPFKHNVVNKHIVKELMKRVVATGVCSKDEFDRRIK